MIQLEPIFNMEKVKEILMIPEVWERAAEDGVIKETFQPGFDSMCGWLICCDENETIGLIYVHNDNAKSIKMHPYILPDQRGKGKQMMFSFYRWILDNCTDVQKLLVTIPFCYKRVYKFAMRVGFIEEGINRKSYFKNGELYDQWNLGLTINEVEELMK